MALKSATSNMEKAKTWNADKFDESKSAYEQAQQLLTKGREAFDSRQFSDALTQSKDAVRQSKEALNRAKTRFAAQQLDAAGKAMEIARINDGQKDHPDLFGKAQKLLDDSRAKHTKQKYEDAINLATECIQTVDQLLAGLKNTAANNLADLEARIVALEAAGANEHLPNAVIKAKESLDQIKKRADEARDYKQANILAQAAITKAQSDLVETKKRKSNLELQTLEAKISEAIAEEAPIYAPDALRTARESFEEILKSYYENQFDTVIAAAELLKPKVDQLITMTRIEATKEKLNTVESSIAALKNQSIEEYLPGRVKAMEDLLAEGRDMFNNNDFDGAKDKSNSALIEQDRILASFDALAEKAIQDASQAYKTAAQTFQRMTEIFTPQGGKSLMDQRVESRREVEQGGLSSTIEAALARLKLANDNRGFKEFKKAIETSKVVQADCETVISKTFRIVAQHSLVSIQDEVSGLERMGARQYAPRQLTQVQTLVEETQKLLTDNQNREAADRAAKTRAYVDNVKQELARRATDERVRGEELMRRVEGGAAPVPASGGRPPLPKRTVQAQEAPGGACGNDKDMQAGDAPPPIISEADAAAMWRKEPIVVAQLKTGHATNSSMDASAGVNDDNKSLSSGTFMHDQAPSGRQPKPEPGTASGAIIGTRPEPVTVTRDQAGNPSNNGSYEGATGPGPFTALVAPAGSGQGVADLDQGAGEEGPGYIAGVRRRVREILDDEQRMRDIRAFQPRSIELARQKLAESGAKLAAQDYLGALRDSEEAQRIILEAEQRAANSRAQENLREAADRINLSEAAGSVAFAPAQMAEAIRLHAQAEDFLAKSDYLMARDASEKALAAADDARMYNVNKARELASLSTRYGGNKAAHPLLAQSEMNAALAESMLEKEGTALQGQEVAKQAVVEAQLALDHARDFSFQERIDNIYKALNTALRAGANYFNVEEVRRLVAELAVARDEYCTRNYDAVEMKLKDVEARLARVIETTPLVLEENLVEVTAKLNALVQAGAENYMAQEVDDVKSLMNRSVIDFRKHDYGSSYHNIRNAMKLTDEIELRLQEQVYFDAVTELFAQLDKTFHDFEGILNFNRTFVKQLATRQNGQMAALSFSGRMSPNNFKDKITDIYLRAIHLKPPKSQEGTHEEVIVAIKFAKAAADNFQKLYILDQLAKPDAYDIIDTAFNQIEKSKTMRGELQVRLIDPQARTKVIRADKIVNF